jgi:hypothetical protein
MMPEAASSLLASSTICGGFMPAGHFSVQIPQVVQVFRLSCTSLSASRPFAKPFITRILPLVLADSQPDSSKTGQTERQVPQRTQRLIDLRSSFIPMQISYSLSTQFAPTHFAFAQSHLLKF